MVRIRKELKRSAVILAGGMSTRMGQEKWQVALGERKMIQWVFDALCPVVDELLISTKQDCGSDLRRMFPNVVIVEDKIPNCGPLIGLKTSFHLAAGSYVAVAPCDTPFIKTALYELLFEKAQGKDGAVIKLNGFYEPLLAVYDREPLLQAIDLTLAKGFSGPVQTYGYLDLAVLKEDEVRAVDPELESFFNVNSPSDLQKAKRLAIGKVKVAENSSPRRSHA